MAKNEISDYDELDSGNTDISGIGLSDATLIDQLDDIARAQMGALARFTGDDTLVAAATTDLGSVPGRYVVITGNTTITGFGTIKAGTLKFLKFSGTPTITYNATSMILPGASNITSAAGDTAIVVSEGSGNWRMLNYLRAGAITNDAQGATIASATTTDISVATGNFIDVSGTTTITGLGTAAAGVEKVLRFTGILTLTYNATSLILYSKTNITTFNGLVMTFRSLGAGNWQETSQTVARGTWTPAPQFGAGNTGLAATGVGIWERNRDDVTLTWSVVFTAKGSSTGNLSTGVLPFIPAATLAQYTGPVHSLNGVSLVAGMTCQVVAGSGGLFYYAPTTGSDIQITHANISNTTELYGTISYRAV